jgi:2-aminoadipate transaminase
MDKKTKLFQKMTKGSTSPSPVFARRMKTTPKSFIREILKVTENPEIISFAGGLPNPDLIDVEELSQAAAEVFTNDGRTALQYATTEGYLPLRCFIADRYKKRLGLTISSDEILITNGSQQCLDLIGKILIDPGDRILIERPGYLGAIQVFSLYEPVFASVNLGTEGPDQAAFESAISGNDVKLFYGIPNSQNPSGITYSAENRKVCAEILKDTSTIVVEDDAYGELQFFGRTLPPIKKYLPDQTILTGSFSKIMAPGMRLGWVCAPRQIMDQLVVAKQASDLHSNYLSQRIASCYLEKADLDAHIDRIRSAYHEQATTMITAMHDCMPEGVGWSHPVGGMFVWVTLPIGCPAMDVFNGALKKQVAVLPGLPFYVDGGGTDTLRLNFSNSSPTRISEGIERLGQVIQSLNR